MISHVYLLCGRERFFLRCLIKLLAHKTVVFFNSWSSTSVVSGESSGRVASLKSSSNGNKPSTNFESKLKTKTIKSNGLWQCKEQILSKFMWQSDRAKQKEISSQSNSYATFLKPSCHIW